MIVGKHTVIDLINYNTEYMEDVEYVKNILISSAHEIGLHVVDSLFYKFKPIGISGVIILSESHITIHTWPEYKFVAVDAFTCGKSIEPEIFCRLIAKKIGASIVNIDNFERGFVYEKKYE